MPKLDFVRRLVVGRHKRADAEEQQRLSIERFMQQLENSERQQVSDAIRQLHTVGSWDDYWRIPAVRKIFADLLALRGMTPEMARVILKSEAGVNNHVLHQIGNGYTEQNGKTPL